MSKEKIESVLRLLGSYEEPACVKGASDWHIKRIDGFVTTHGVGGPLMNGEEWLLIGEITEALREKGVWSMEQEWADDDSGACLIARTNSEHFKNLGPTLLDCYLQAATELLGEEVI